MLGRTGGSLRAADARRIAGNGGFVGEEAKASGNGEKDEPCGNPVGTNEIEPTNQKNGSDDAHRLRTTAATRIATTATAETRGDIEATPKGLSTSASPVTLLESHHPTAYPNARAP
ncbi:hypothetical protein BRDID11018_34000 [Bradyrhizobium diazoefficiens]